MRTFASSLRRLGAHLAAVLPHNHGHLTQPGQQPAAPIQPIRRARHCADTAESVVTSAELRERLVPEYARYAEDASKRRAAAKERRNAGATTLRLPVHRETPEVEARNALAHTVMRGADVTWMDRDDIPLGIDYVKPVSGEVIGSVNVEEVAA